MLRNPHVSLRDSRAGRAATKPEKHSRAGWGHTAGNTSSFSSAFLSQEASFLSVLCFVSSARWPLLAPRSLKYTQHCRTNKIKTPNVQDYAPAQQGRQEPRVGDGDSDNTFIHYDGQGVYSVNTGVPRPPQASPSGRGPGISPQQRQVRDKYLRIACGVHVTCIMNFACLFDPCSRILQEL